MDDKTPIKHWPEIVIDIPMLEVKNRKVHLNGPLGLKWLNEKIDSGKLTDEHKEMIREALVGYKINVNSLNDYMLVVPLYKAGILSMIDIDRMIGEAEVSSDFHFTNNAADESNVPKTSSRRSLGLQVLDGLEATGTLTNFQQRLIDEKKNGVVADVMMAARSEFLGRD